MILASFDTCGDRLFDERLTAIKQYIEEHDVDDEHASAVLRTWIVALERGMDEGLLNDAMAARRAINILDGWREQISERKAA